MGLLKFSPKGRTSGHTRGHQPSDVIVALPLLYTTIHTNVKPPQIKILPSTRKRNDVHFETRFRLYSFAEVVIQPKMPTDIVFVGDLTKSNEGVSCVDTGRKKMSSLFLVGQLLVYSGFLFMYETFQTRCLVMYLTKQSILEPQLVSSCFNYTLILCIN